MGKFWIERCVCAPHNDPGGMDNDPKESDSSRVGKFVMMASSSKVDEVGEGWMDDRTPGINVA